MLGVGSPRVDAPGVTPVHDGNNAVFRRQVVGMEVDIKHCPVRFCNQSLHRPRGVSPEGLTFRAIMVNLSGHNG